MELTERQKQLFEYIKSHDKVSQWDIYKNVEGYEWNFNNKTHDHCPTIWHDIMCINEDMTKPIIITKDFEYWIGSEEETKQYLIDLWIKLAGRLHRHWHYVKKARKHGQIYEDFDEELHTVYEAWKVKNHIED